MKIQLEQIKGSLRNKVDDAIAQLKESGCNVIAFFLFKDTCHDYSWRSKGKYIAIRYTKPTWERHKYEDKRIYLQTK